MQLECALILCKVVESLYMIQVLDALYKSHLDHFYITEEDPLFGINYFSSSSFGAAL